MTLLEVRGSLSIPVTKVIRMLSLSSEFQIQCGVDTADDALRNISVTRRDQDRIQRPFACVNVGDSHTYRQFSGGSKNHLTPGGAIGLFMTMDTNPEYRMDLDSASLEAGNFFGSVMDDIVALSGEDDPDALESHLPIKNVERTAFTNSEDGEEDVIGSFFWTVYQLDWGFE
jgi:hypothetical protein